MKKTLPEIVERRRVYAGWNRMDELTVTGLSSEAHKREVIDHGDAASLLPYDAERRTVLLVRQWRAPLAERPEGGFIMEACAGIIDPGETPEEAALREAEEELGVTLGKAEHVASVYPAPGCLTELAHLFLSPYRPEDRKGAGGGKDEEGEAIEVVEISFDRLFALVREAGINDAKTLVLAQALLLRGL
ncbi:NUDIX domain-containing protein [Afifella sp. YEN Y35]|uniref:NUDIX domain-containing protein n=1 Tax=Afifella sp. YEN Y35 TaxID=3388337 RepID=UPI0039E1B5DB